MLSGSTRLTDNLTTFVGVIPTRTMNGFVQAMCSKSVGRF